MKNQTLNKLDKNAVKNLTKAINALQTEQEVQDFLLDLCTPNEIQAMADRWQVVPAINAGKPYRQIYEETGISVTTVGRVARSLLFGTGAYKLIYERLQQNKINNK